MQPAVFKALVSDVLRNFLNLYVFEYLNNILIFSRPYEEHVQQLHTVLQWPPDNKLFVKVKKCYKVIF